MAPVIHETDGFQQIIGVNESEPAMLDGQPVGIIGTPEGGIIRSAYPAADRTLKPGEVVQLDDGSTIKPASLVPESGSEPSPFLDSAV